MLGLKKSNLRKRILLALLITSISSTAFALPQNGTVTAGGGSIAQSGNTMNVTQNTAKMGVNWQSFNIAKNETVNFKQPNASSVALNRIVGNDASVIYGSLNANGQVFLINPNGVTFAAGASINVGGIAASTKDITDANFLASKYNFTGTSTAGVTNQGSLNATEGGYVALMANNVNNEGSITAPRGTIALGAGNAFTLSADISGKVNLAVDEAAVNAAAVNKGNIKADGGYVVMKANDAAKVINSVVTNTGIIEAKSLKNQNGEIVLDGADQGVVNVGGTLNTNAAEANTAGGNITVKGLYTNINSDANLSAKATGSQTGGTIDTSGAYLYIAPEAIINASSEKGMGGTWSLDPLYVIIDDNTSGKAWSATTYDNNSDSAITTHVLASSIQSSLNNGTSVAITAEDNNKVADILVESPITKTTGGDATLTLKAQREIRIDANIKSSFGKLAMEFWSDSAGRESGAVILNADLDSHGGDITMGSGSSITAGTVGTYIGITEAELKKLIDSDTRTPRNVVTYGGNLKIYGDLLLATGDFTNFNTVAANGTDGGSVLVDGRIDSGNFYKAIKAGDGNNLLTWDKARTLAYTNSQGITTTGGADIWDSYLTNITSNLENSVVASTFEKTSMYTAYFIGAYTKGIHTLPRTWYWADGPEAGKTFFQQTIGKTTATDTNPHGTSAGMDYTYSKWHAGEPNNDNGNGQNIATIGYGWDAKWDDNLAGNQKKGNDEEIPGYIQETNMVRSALNITSGKGDVEVTGKIGSQRTLWQLDVNNTGNVTFKGSVQLSGDYYTGKQFYSDMNIYSSGNVTMRDFVDATGNINIGYDKSGNTIATGIVEADSSLTAQKGAVAIGSDSATTRAASALLKGQVTAGTGVAIYTSGNVESDTGILANGNDVTDLATGGTRPALSTPKVLGNVVINDSGADSKITLKGTTTVGSAVDTKDDITLYGDKIDLQGPVTTNGTTGVVTVSNYTAGNTIDLGSTVDTTANTLELSDSEIDKITASKLVVGNNDSATATKNINITNAITPAGTSVVHMYTGVTGGQIKETTAAGTLAPGASGTLNLAITADTQVYLDNANNITKFAATSKGDTSKGDTTNDTIRLNNGENTLTIDTVDSVSGVTSDATNNKNTVILATHSNFVNNVGSTGVSVPTTSNWRIFSNSPTPNTFGPGAINTYLKSGSYADWSTKYVPGDTVGTKIVGTDTSSNQDDTASHYIFMTTPTLVLAPIDLTKKYGEDYNIDKHTKGVKDTNYTVIGTIYDSAAASDEEQLINAVKSIAISSKGFDKQASVGTYKGDTEGILLNIVWKDGTPLKKTTASTNGYLVEVKTGILTITPASLVIDVTGKRTYGATKSGDTFASATYTVNDSTKAIANGLMDFDAEKYTAQVYDVATYKDNTLANTAAKTSYTSIDGTYLTLGTTTQAADVLKNYTVFYHDIYTIEKADLTINVTAERGYGDTKNTKTGLFDTGTYTVDNSNIAQTHGLKSWDATAYNSAINNGASKLADSTDATTNAGTYTDGKIALTAAVKASSVLANYNVTYTDKYIIDKAALTITTTGSKTYGDADPATSSYKMTASGWKNSDATSVWNANKSTWQETITNSTDETTAKGTYTGVLGYSSATMPTDLANYNVTYKDNFVINPATLDVTVEGSKVYGDASSTNIGDYTANANAAQLKNSNTVDLSGLTLTNSVGKTDNVGSYYNNYTGETNTADNVTVSGTLTGAIGFKASNYDIHYHTKYQVTPAPLTITTTGSKTYGEADPATDSYSASATGWKNSDETTIWNANKSTWQAGITNSTDETTDAGAYGTKNSGTQVLDYSTKAAMATALSNYTLTYADGFTVTPAPLDVTVEGSKVYGDASSTNISDYNANANAAQLKNSNTVDLSGLTLTNSVGKTDNVGSYYNNYTGEITTTDNVSVTGGIAGAIGFDINNYTIAYHTKYDVTPAPLTIAIDNKTALYGSAIPPLTDRYVGLKNGDTSSTILDNGIYTTAVMGSPKGSYPIDFSGLPNNPNYTITLVPGILTILQQPADPTTPVPVTPIPVTPIPVVPTPITPSPTAPNDPGTNTTPTTKTIPGSHSGEDENGGLDHNIVRIAMPTYLNVNNHLTRVGAYDVADSQDGVKMHPTLNTVPDPKDDKSELRETTVAYTQNNITGIFKVIFDGSIVKVAPEDAAANQMVAKERESRYVEIFKGALNTALNDMGIVLESVRAMYLLM